MPAEGSSSNIIGGLPSVAIATESLRLLPPDNVPASLLRWSAMLRLLIAFSISFYRLASGMPFNLA